MEKQKKEKKKYSTRIGWKRSLILTLVLALILGTYSFADFGPKAQAAEYSRIIGIDTYHEGNTLDGGNTVSSLELEGGNRVRLNANKGQLKQGEFIKTRTYTAGSSTSVVKNLYITLSGDLFYQEGTGTPVKMASNAVDFEGYAHYNNTGFDSFFILKSDGTVEAWGRGANGQLGIGYAQDKTVATKLVDPADSTEDLKGIKKIIPMAQNPGKNSMLLVGDGKVYLIGVAFGYDSLPKATPVDITSFFPAFSTADEFDMFRLNNESKDSTAATVRVFEIAGSQYTLIDTTKFNKEISGTLDTSSTTLYPVPAGINARNLTKVSGSVTNQYAGTENRTLYVSLDNGVLSYWGTAIDKFNDIYSLESSSGKPFSSEIKQVATGVDYISTNLGGNIYFVKNGNLFYIGPNASASTGVVGGPFVTPLKITGPANELTDLKKFAVGSGGNFYLKNDNTLISWSGTGATFTHSKKYIDIFTIRESTSTQTVLGITDDYQVHTLYKGSNSVNVLESNLKVIPKDYVTPVTNPDKPVLSITSQDKFNQSIVSINYGTTGDIATKQYQINGGGWLDYTGDIIVTQSGSVTIQARSADGNGNMSEVGELTITSDPIVITAGHPKIDKIAADEFKISADSTGTVKVQVRVDGAAWQDFNTANNLLLTPGNHTIEIRLLNDRDQELINKTFDVTADNPAPVVVGKPVVTQKGLNNLYGLDIEVSYDASEGEALYSIDGGEWISTTGSFSVSNAAHTIRAKVVTAGGKESEVTEFVTTVSHPKITVNNDQVSIELGINTSDVTVHYKDSNNQWVEYTGPVSYGPGTHNIEIEVRDSTGTPVFSGGPYTVTVIDPNAGNPGGGGTTPTPDPGTGTPIGEEDVDFTVNSGGLSSRFEGADLSTIIIDNTNPYQSINSVSRALIEDSRGNGKGYQYSLDVTDFVSDPMQDNSTNSQSLVVSIPANSLSVDVLNTKTITGPAAELSNVGKHVFTGTGPEMLATAKAFEGMGYVEIPLNFTLSIPDRVKIISSGSGSKFVPGESTGLMAGIYKSRFTFTLSSGI
ncbi:hypothetical protein QP794_23425 [Paenibacillus sp. UMB7766-LJ446]|uniref:hypothetical protein n=1 Tax=Paenibacillus sp. UMB7766-LJ446 TaxID=3046313 RepID=UPI00254FE645|nr:hypothetical protein [Paenibacillus sp. UMB7766-LJ446]MDK8193045.1 hypothetical protein [Paenibacillus sp. UMB7766-LJ446]